MNAPSTTAGVRPGDATCPYCRAPGRSFWRHMLRWKKCNNGHKFIKKSDDRT